jgi:hypothetical protein
MIDVQPSTRQDAWRVRMGRETARRRLVMTVCLAALAVAARSAHDRTYTSFP